MIQRWSDLTDEQAEVRSEAEFTMRRLEARMTELRLQTRDRVGILMAMDEAAKVRATSEVWSALADDVEAHRGDDEALWQFVYGAYTAANQRWGDLVLRMEGECMTAVRPQTPDEYADMSRLRLDAYAAADAKGKLLAMGEAHQSIRATLLRGIVG